MKVLSVRRLTLLLLLLFPLNASAETGKAVDEIAEVECAYDASESSEFIAEELYPELWEAPSLEYGEESASTNGQVLEAVSELDAGGEFGHFSADELTAVAEFVEADKVTDAEKKEMCKAAKELVDDARRLFNETIGVVNKLLAQSLKANAELKDLKCRDGKPKSLTAEIKKKMAEVAAISKDLAQARANRDIAQSELSTYEKAYKALGCK